MCLFSKKGMNTLSVTVHGKEFRVFHDEDLGETLALLKQGITDLAEIEGLERLTGLQT